MYTVAELIETLRGIPDHLPVCLCFRGMFATVDLVAVDLTEGRAELYNEVDASIVEVDQ